MVSDGASKTKHLRPTVPAVNDTLGEQDAMLSQGEPRDAAINFDTYQIL